MLSMRLVPAATLLGAEVAVSRKKTLLSLSKAEIAEKLCVKWLDAWGDPVEDQATTGTV